MAQHLKILSIWQNRIIAVYLDDHKEIWLG